MKILLLTPPMTQLNTPYPATAYLTGFLRGREVGGERLEVTQRDLSILLIHRIFSRAGLTRVLSEITRKKIARASKSVAWFVHHAEDVLNAVEPAISFLSGRDSTLAMRLASRRMLPEGPRFRALTEFSEDAEEQLTWAFGTLGVQDRAKYLATLFLDDLADVIRDAIDPRFELSRYGEKLAASTPTFDALSQSLEAPAPTLIDEFLDELTRDVFREVRPDVLGLSAPFPGNVYGAFRIAKKAREFDPRIKTVLGGGYVNTELRELKEPRVFNYFDALTLDDGERAFLCLIEWFLGKRDSSKLLRTFIREAGVVTLKHDPREHDIPARDAGTPTYDGLDLTKYLSILEMPNPMHRVWSDGRWNKLTLAHGCYWKKCNFCDVTLDYINRYDANPADLIVDRMVKLVEETGQSGFHFVDEAAPPAVLRQLAERLIERKVNVTWWGNIRFEKTFTPELCALLARSGCVAVSGGLEVASDRLLKLMNKGVSVEQVARVTRAFAESGVLVHAYLMYGFPTQTTQETIDALERVRQLFVEGCIDSAFWHRFAVTAHSPIGKEPEKFGITIHPPTVPVTFARNDLEFTDPTKADHDRLGLGLKRALYNYMHGVGFDMDVREWFTEMDSKVPKPQVPPDLIRVSLHQHMLSVGAQKR